MANEYPHNKKKAEKIMTTNNPTTEYAKKEATKVASRLHAQRTDKGWSQQKLADMAGIDRKTVNRIENGHFSPSMETFFMLCRAMKVTPTQLIVGK